MSWRTLPGIHEARQVLGTVRFLLNARDFHLHSHMTPQEKRAILRSFATCHRFFVETGTYLGHTAIAMADVYERVYTAEIDVSLYQKFRDHVVGNKIQALLGDSVDVLPSIISELDSAAVFWLDAHCSGGLTSKGRLETVIEQELEIIFADRRFLHTVLIDDARLFGCYWAYPTIETLEKIAKKKRGYSVTIRDDIIRMLPDPELSLKRR